MTAGHKLAANYWDPFIDMCSDKYNTTANESIWEAEFAGNNTSDTQAEGRIGNIIGLAGPDLSSKSDVTGAKDPGYGYAFIYSTPKLYNLYVNNGDTKRFNWSIAPFEYKEAGGKNTGVTHREFEQGKLAEVMSQYGQQRGTYQYADDTEKTTATKNFSRMCGKYRREYEADKKDKNYTSINFPILRYADVLLMIAEAENEANNGLLEAFAACNDLAPLHNPANLKGVDAITAILPNVPQIGVFDTAFHQTMPEHAYLYAIPYELYKKYGVRRYGFHGTSHRYVSQRVCEYLGIKPEGLKLITCHIGNGGSIAAIKDGKCIDTSMGLTPLEGLMMGTRSGDIDAGAVTFIMDKEGLTTTGISNLLNKKSGVAGMMNGSSDMRDLEAAVAKGDPQAILTEQMYFYRIKKYIGAYAAALGGVDVILFTGGVGENQATCRAGVCEGLEFLGVKLDPEKNKVRGEEAIISTDDSRVKVVVIPTDEELLIASDTMAILDK